MLKIRSTPTEAEWTGYINSQSTEPEKAEFHTPAIPNMVRPCKNNTAHFGHSSFCFFGLKIRRQGGNHRCTCTGDSQGTRYLHSRISKVNKKELWAASQFI